MNMLATPLHPPQKGRGREDVREGRPFRTIRDRGPRWDGWEGEPRRMEYSRSRKWCEGSCQRKTGWVAVYFWKKWRVCWECMSPSERQLIRDGY